MDIHLDTEFSSLSLPTAPLPGYFDDFNRAAGPVGYTSAERRPYVGYPSPPTASPIPLVVDAGAARRGVVPAGATKSFWAPESYAADGVLSARVKNLGDATGALMFRADDAENGLILACRADASIRQYRLFRRLNDATTTLASSGSVESATGDLVQVLLDKTTITVKINGANIFGGPRTIADFSTKTRHGVLIYASSTGAETWDSLGFAAVV